LDYSYWGVPVNIILRLKELETNPPQLFICGHSHILKVIFDKRIILHMNPGACGKSGFHQVRTMLRFIIDGDKIKELELLSWKSGSKFFIFNRGDSYSCPFFWA
jgi:hypothetical protein